MVKKLKLIVVLTILIIAIYSVFKLSQSTVNNYDFSNLSLVPAQADVTFFDTDPNDSSLIYVKVSHKDYVTQVIAIDTKSTQQQVKLKPRLFFDVSVDETYRVNDINVLFKAIPSGEFTMGSEQHQRTKPLRKMHVNAFRIMEHEVSWALYQACVDDGLCPVKEKPALVDLSHPVTGVNWQEITESFIPWFNQKVNSKFRLPSETEWEYVAKGSRESRYHWGEDIEIGLANCWGCGSNWDNISTSPIKSFPANDFGVYDMHGNVWEWTADCFADNYQALRFRDSRANQNIGCERRVIRGGGYRFRPMFMDASFRGRDFTHVSSNADGFRLAQGNL